jgi:hypothetical protein
LPLYARNVIKTAYFKVIEDGMTNPVLKFTPAKTLAFLQPNAGPSSFRNILNALTPKNRSEKGQMPPDIAHFYQGVLTGGSTAAFTQYRVNKFSGVSRWAKGCGAAAATLNLIYSAYLLTNAVGMDAKNGSGIKLWDGAALGRNTAIALGALVVPAVCAALVLAGKPQLSVGTRFLLGTSWGMAGGFCGAYAGSAIYDRLSDFYTSNFDHKQKFTPQRVSFGQKAIMA